QSPIFIGSFTSGKIASIIGLRNKNYKYDVGQILSNVNSGKLLIINKIRTKNGENYTNKGYEYECQYCGNIDKISESNLNKNVGCSVCSGQKVLRGYNDLWTINPKIANMLKNKERGYELS